MNIRYEIELHKGIFSIISTYRLKLIFIFIYHEMGWVSESMNDCLDG